MTLYRLARRELDSGNNTQIKTWINTYNGISETDYVEGEIQLDSSAKCGAVYRFGLHADFDVNRMEPVVVGGAYNSDGDADGNKCDVKAISNPDNLAVMDDGRVFIGEDTSKHVNNALWMYNPQGE
jgi:secreted PhoX family phosphatase